MICMAYPLKCSSLINTVLTLIFILKITSQVRDSWELIHAIMFNGTISLIFIPSVFVHCLPIWKLQQTGCGVGGTGAGLQQETSNLLIGCTHA